MTTLHLGCGGDIALPEAPITSADQPNNPCGPELRDMSPADQAPIEIDRLQATNPKPTPISASERYATASDAELPSPASSSPKYEELLTDSPKPIILSSTTP